MKEKKAITKPMIQAAIIVAIFYAFEVVFVYCDLFPNREILWTVDSLLRIALGTVGLFLLKKHADAGESKFTVKELFTNKIPPKTWILLIPFIITCLLPFVNIFTANYFTTEFIVALCILIFQQFATGYFEEGVQRGLIMNGLIMHRTETVKQRIFTVVITGAFFGLGHLPIVVFGENPLIQVPHCLMVGMFWAAIYMLSDNLLLLMLLHAISDSTPRIMGYLFNYPHDSVVCKVADYLGDAIDYVVLPLVAIYICVHFDKLKNYVTNRKREN
ncbi:MAG: CPBP family intramembrane metalloprotease [Lachnospiraceae bacterium]|nr:CPBP family intramembrane metalloprotease [Lachnospiraceae bacterium]